MTPKVPHCSDNEFSGPTRDVAVPQQGKMGRNGKAARRGKSFPLSFLFPVSMAKPSKQRRQKMVLKSLHSPDHDGRVPLSVVQWRPWVPGEEWQSLVSAIQCLGEGGRAWLFFLSFFFSACVLRSKVTHYSSC